ncbi:hypothetical protein [Enhygromyxa salina]|uniref:Thymidylate synthase n=1 Tax=Enhygromyxa salina TaxID=215803 RepID=A0A2S9YAA3_9BACT|nr:hypothetical protein [Enhygromyxa salina]PRQ02033.1 thymidylate synthase [Enhygromyxa salina]
MKPHAEPTLESAWIAACLHLFDQPGREQHHLVFEIMHPCAQPQQWQMGLRDGLDKFLKKNTKGEWQPVHTVAETIFPAGLYEQYGTDGVYEIYPNEVYPAIKGSHWGRYAYLLVRRLDSKGKVALDDGVPINPLRRCIDRMNRQLTQKSNNRVIYEMDFVEDLAGELQFTRMSRREPNPANGPCLSHLSMKFSSDRKLHLAAIYRSHFYAQKALGNLLGLSRLMAFVCEQTGLEPGRLLCVSTHARLEFPNYVKDLKQFKALLEKFNQERLSP